MRRTRQSGTTTTGAALLSWPPRDGPGREAGAGPPPETAAAMTASIPTQSAIRRTAGDPPGSANAETTRQLGESRVGRFLPGCGRFEQWQLAVISGRQGLGCRTPTALPRRQDPDTSPTHSRSVLSAFPVTTHRPDPFQRPARAAFCSERALCIHADLHCAFLLPFVRLQARRLPGGGLRGEIAPERQAGVHGACAAGSCWRARHVESFGLWPQCAPMIRQRRRPESTTMPPPMGQGN